MIKLTYKVRKTIINKNKNIETIGCLYIEDCLNDNVSYFFNYIANSGKYGKGTMPLGKYELKKPIILIDEEGNRPYKKDGDPWYCELVPLFNCDRTGLCIHPDGGVKGTLGCLGIEKNDLILLDDIQRAFREQEKLYLEVI